MKNVSIFVGLDVHKESIDVALVEGYVEGLEEDAEKIYHYFGEDFITPRKRENPIPFRYSTGHSRRVDHSIISTSLSF